jgi:thiamine-phosphate pyrophosphorylase
VTGSRALPGGLLLITDRYQARRSLMEITAAAFDAGFIGIMLREKDLAGGDLLEVARPLAELARTRGRAFLVNDRIDVALALAGAGVHVGHAGLGIADARRLLGPDRLLGYSAHAIEEARAALADGADYVTLSPIFPSRSKPDLSPRGLAFLQEGTAALPPGCVVALGGIDAAGLAGVRGAGAHGAAVMGAMMRAEDPAVTARDLVAAWGERSAS